MNDSTSATSPAWPTRWPKDSFTGVWTWLLAGFITLLVAIAFVLGLRGGNVPPVSPIVVDFGILFQALVEGGLVVLVLVAMPLLSKFTLEELGFRALTPAAAGGSLIGAVGMFVVASGGASLIDYLVHSRHEQDVLQIFKQLHDPVSIVLFVGFAVVVAPFAEEALFRVFFFNIGLRYAGFWGGATLSGILFGIAHGDLYAGIPLALGGVVLCAVYYRTRNAFAPMISHALFNGITIALLLFVPKAAGL